MKNGREINSKHNLTDKNLNKIFMLNDDARTMHIFSTVLIKVISFSLKRKRLIVKFLESYTVVIKIFYCKELSFRICVQVIFSSGY